VVIHVTCKNNAKRNFFLDTMGYNLRYPWSLWYHSIYDEELNGNNVQLSAIGTQSSNVLFPVKATRKDASEMSYFDFRGQQLAETFKQFQFLLFGKVYYIKYFDAFKYE